MSNIEEIKSMLWLYSTGGNHPWTVEQAYRNLHESGSRVVDGLIWALDQDDKALQLLALELLQNHYPDATLALPAVRFCIRGDDRLVRVTAIVLVYRAKNWSW